MRIVAATLIACVALSTSHALAQDLLFSESFETGFTGWVASGLWQPAQSSDVCASPIAPFPSGVGCAYYGLAPACNFDTGAANSGTLTSTVSVTLPPAAPSRFLWLRAWTFLRSEHCDSGYDLSDVEVSIDGGASWLLAGSLCGFLGGTKFGNFSPWEEFLIDLAPFAGQTILLRLRFDSVDEQINQERGWFVDDLSIRVEPGEPVCPTYPGCPCNQALQFGVPYPTTAHGCASSITSNVLYQGAALLGRGTPSHASDNVRLLANRLPPNAATVLLQGQYSQSPVVFLGDGHLCLSGRIERRGAQAATSAGTVEWPGPHGTPLSGFAPIGTSVSYQLWYRDPVPAYCTPSSVNLSNAYRVTWLP